MMNNIHLKIRGGKNFHIPSNSMNKLMIILSEIGKFQLYSNGNASATFT